MRSHTSFLGIGIVSLAVVVVLFLLVAHTRSAELVPATSSDLASILPREATSSLADVMPAREVHAGPQEYRSARYHFSLLYPEGMEVGFFDEGAGAGTFTFQNAEAAKGFEIFVVPYTGDRMFEDRFKQDVHSGMLTDVTNVVVASTTGISFYSTNAHLGETREVWFTHNGLLYEVLTFKSLDTWLDKILATWQFI